MTAEPPDVEITLSFRAAELTLHGEPRLRTRTYPGEADRVDDRVRENLPADPSPGHTYRDVHWRRRLGARLGTEAGEASEEGEKRGD